MSITSVTAGEDRPGSLSLGFEEHPRQRISVKGKSSTDFNCLAEKRAIVNNLRRYILRLAIAAIITGGGITAFVWSATLAEDRPVRVDTDGTLHTPALTTIPPSGFWSSEFKEAYLKNVTTMLEEMRGQRFKVPEATASKSEWDKFDAEEDRYLAPYLVRAKEHYPIDVVDTKMAGVHVGRITPKNGVAPENEHRVLINLHGGGFVSGRGLATGQIESIPVASIGRIEVVTVDYRQAPYYKFPAGTEDVEAVYRELLKHYKPEAIGIFGTSAGGVLAAQALAAFEAKGLPRPGAVGLFWAGPGPFWSPLFTKQGDSMMWIRAFYPQKLPQASLKVPVDYMEGADATDPVANPSSSDTALARFPPTLFITGTRAFDMSPAIVAHARLLKLGVESSLYIMEGAGHAADFFSQGTSEQRDVDTYKASWFNQHLAR
jgi:acetyl esterase/lipase